MFSVQTQYGIKTLSYLAKYEHQKTYILTNEIAIAFNLSKQFLDKTIKKLKKAKLVKSKTGKSGGNALLKAAKDISLFDIIQATESNVYLLKCLMPQAEKCETCQSIETCSLSIIFKDAQNKFFEQLKMIKLSEMIIHNNEIINKKPENFDYII